MRSHARIALAAAGVAAIFITLFTTLRVKKGHNAIPGVAMPDPPAWFSHGPGRVFDDEEDGDAIRWAKKNGDYRILTSIRNNRGFYNKVDVQVTGYEIMNPTFLELPRGKKIKHDFLVIARTTHVDKTIKGKKYKLARQVAMFANLDYTNTGRPVIKADDKWTRLLVEDYGTPNHHCRRQPDMDKYIGPEDMKLFWTAKGEPLLIFTHQIDDRIRCQGQFIIDVRAALPELEELLGDEFTKKLPGIRFKKPVGLRRKAPQGQEDHPRYQREKNWAPVQSPFSKDDGELFFMVEPGQLYRYEHEDDPVDKIVREKDQRSAVEAPYPPYVPPKDTWRSKDHTCMHDVMLSNGHVHQSTPMISLTLCNRGTCTPTADNTVMLGMVQRRYDQPTWYDRRIAAYSPVAPYQMLSVSKKLTYHGEVEDGTYAWTGSMLYFTHHKNFPPPNHGYLDDEVWLSFGIKDSDAGWIDIRAGELVMDHYLCEGASLPYRMRSSESRARSLGIGPA